MKKKMWDIGMPAKKLNAWEKSIQELKRLMEKK